jgi:hypothetical protein
MYFVALYNIVAACFLLLPFCDRRFNAHPQNAYASVMPSSHVSFVRLMDEYFLAQKSGFRSCFL